MIKQFIKRIAHAFFKIGKAESTRLASSQRQRFLNEISIIDPTAWISDETVISNNSLPKENIKIGAYSRIMGQLFLFDASGEITIKDNCFVGPDTRIWSANKISIGSRVLIAHGVNIHDNNSHPLEADIRHSEFVNFYKTGVHQKTDLRSLPIVIEDDVWIGFNSIILKGVTIGRGAIIGAGSVVTKDVEPWTINVGNPSRCIERIEKLNF